jgi:uncharacterized repeat protein (TIGR02543 family)
MKNEERKINKGKRVFLTLLSVICYLLFVVGCDNPITSKDGTALPPAGKGSFSLTLSGTGRTVLPNTPVADDFAVYHLAFTPTDGGEAANEDRTNETLADPVLLEPGTYSLTVNAFKDNAKTLLLARGTLNNITITAGQNTPAAVTLEALFSGGVGTFRWDITLPAGVTATMTITPIGAGGTAEQTVTLSNTAGSRPLNSGQYKLAFLLNKTDGKTAVWKELLHVYQNLESVFSMEFTDEHLSDTAYTVTYNYGYNEQTSERSVLHGGKLPPNNPDRVGYTFEGWYTDDAFADAYDFDQPVIESFTLYARWVVVPSTPAGTSMDEAIPLTENIWADGNLPTSSDEQWFTFTATASAQRIHVEFGTLTDLYVRVYDSNGTAVGSETNLYGYSPTISRSLTTEETYYIRVRPYSSGSGDYRIAFNTTIYPPGTTFIPLTENQWADGNIPTSSDVQWFTFTATASTQYIHFAVGTLSRVYVQVYDSSGATVGSETNLYSSTTNTSRTLTTGQTYCIRVRPLNSRGAYRIGFTASIVPPGAIPLTSNRWADGNKPTSSNEQWFRFTATASTQYIHVEFGTLTDLYVQVYDSSGTVSGSETRLYSSTKYASRTLTTGQTYYIRVRPYSSSYSGDYRIGFSSSSDAPVIPLPSNAILLTENQWADGNLPTSGQQLFVFTATASTQYIYVSYGTLTYGMYVRVYDSNGTEVGSQTYLGGSTTNTSRTLTSGQTYYIRVRPTNNTGSDTYQIAFNTSTTAPPFQVPSYAIPLTLNTWANGNMPTVNGQWFTFTATASTQYLHTDYGDLYMQVYDSSSATVGSESRLYGSTSISRALTAGETYYIRVRPYSDSGGYKIGFTESTSAPFLTSTPIPLTEDEWVDGNLPTASGEQWFSFTATASTQYIHVDFGTLTDLYVQVYNSSGGRETTNLGIPDIIIGNPGNPPEYTYTFSRNLTAGQTFYIRVMPRGSGGSNRISGTYRIGFTTSTNAPIQ